MRFIFSLVLNLLVIVSYAQGVKISATPGSPNASSVLELESTSQGLLPPRMTSAQRDAIVSPARGLRIYNLDSDCENYYNGSTWRELCGNCVPAVTSAAAGADQLNLSGTTATLAGNTPGSGVTGTWSTLSGSGGNFSGSPTSNTPAAIFTGTGGSSYTLRWTMSNVCGSTQDDVQISFVAPFVCGTSSITDVQANSYTTVQIGTQCWMRQNLKTTQYRNGTAITYPGTDNSAWSTNNTGAYAWYNNDSNNGNTYGALYNYYALINVNGLCPTGWHVPTDAEVTTLTTFLGGESSAGGAMKSTTGWNAPNTGATNSSGFTALPGGFRNGGSGSFAVLGSNMFMWTSTAFDSGNSWYRNLDFINAVAYRDNVTKTFGNSVRCLKD